jgi:soluble lytic murein transglycosylase-like protein
LNHWQILRGTLAAVALWSAVPTPVAAQIYTWRDANGHLVLSDRPTGPVERTYRVQNAGEIRTTRPTPPLSPNLLYDDLILEHARRNEIPADLIRAVVQVESGFNPYATSPKGAMGLMQLMPATARRFGVVNPYNPIENISAGVAYLRQLLDRYRNDDQLALAAYNAGPGAVDRHGQTVPPYRETREYVARISRISSRHLETRRKVIYKTTESVDGRDVPRYSDSKPKNGVYEVVAPH